MKQLAYKNFIDLDKEDPLFGFKDMFFLPKNITYFDGNSLGPLPKSTNKNLEKMINKEWGEGLIRSWNKENWINMPIELGNKISSLIGGLDGEVIVTDSTSINLFKVLYSALLLNKNRKVIVSEEENFPSDLYILEGIKELLGKNYKIHLIKKGDEKFRKYIDYSTAVVVLSHVNYKTGRINNIKEITKFAKKKGALVIWDISHSVGVMPLNLHDDNVDFAVGCTYKHLNGGPGAPGFLYVHDSLIQRAQQPLKGWMGHIKPFKFELKYHEANNINKYICGTPSIIAYKVIESGLSIFENTSLQMIRKKSIQLSEIFIKLINQECFKYNFNLISPKNAEQRGSQVSFTHENAFSIIQALIFHGFIGDFREPNILRFGLSPLYMRYVDIWNIISCLKKIMETKEWHNKKFSKKEFVT